MRHKKKLSVSKIIRDFFRFIKNLKKEEKLFFVYLVILFLLIIFLPIVKITSFDDDGKNSLLLLRNNVYFFKSFLIIIVAMLILIGRNRSSKIRNVISLLFGFKEVPFLLNFGLLRVILTSYIGINEGVGVVDSITKRVELTSSYFIVVVLVLFGLLYSLYLTLQQSKQSKKLKDIYIQEEKSDPSKEQMKGLFSKMKSE